MKKEEYRGECEPRPLVGRVVDLCFYTYDHLLFEGLSFMMRKGEVTAITGKSGAGKTVILKILAGMERPDAGRVEILTERMSYVPQELGDLGIDREVRIIDMFKQARGLTALEEEIRKYERLIEQHPERYGEVAERYGEALEMYDKLGGYQVESDINRLLIGLRVDRYSTGKITPTTRLSEVSSGQLRRIMIARALYARPDLLLMDDPTSHLDVAGVEWLLSYLKQTDSAVVIASNNRDFIDGCAAQTIGLTDVGRVFVFGGGYTESMRKRDRIIAAEQAAAEVVARKITQLKETDRMFRERQAYKKSPSMAQVGRALKTRIRKLEEEFERMPGSKNVFRNEEVRDLVFEVGRKSGEDVLLLEGVVKKYGDYTAVKVESEILIRRGEKWLVWGPNGSGKSTLIRMIVDAAMDGNFLPDEGQIVLGAGVEMAYFMPDRLCIPESGVILEEVVRFVGEVTERARKRAVSVLRFFGFGSNAIHHQDIRTLSSGERKRLALAVIMLRNPNFIVLDEPTGDYMPEVIKERLASALRDYEGTLLLVSHDEEFMDIVGPDMQLNMPEGTVLIRR